MIRNNIIKTPSEADRALNENQQIAIGGSQDCGKLGNVFRPSSLLKSPLSGFCRNTWGLNLPGGSTQTLLDATGWYAINTGNPAVSVGSYTFFTNVYLLGNVLERMTGTSRLVLNEMSIATVDAQAFTGTVELVRTNPFGKSSSDFLDFNEAIDPKSQFNWFYQFRNMNLILDQFSTIRFIMGAEAIKVSMKFSLIENSKIMRML